MANLEELISYDIQIASDRKRLAKALAKEGVISNPMARKFCRSATREFVPGHFDLGKVTVFELKSHLDDGSEMHRWKKSKVAGGLSEEKCLICGTKYKGRVGSGRRVAFNKFNPQELLSQLVTVLRQSGLQEEAKKIKTLSGSIMEAWSKREK
tara:strand:+ start:29 stop:487 length:459 start_codon:yes stop_codon:yes gene_type:complete